MRFVAILLLSAGLMFVGCNAGTDVAENGSTSTVALSGSTGTLESWAGTQAELDTLVAEGKPVILDFYADW